MKEYDVYSDISRRTNGEMFIGVVGPVRTGKSTFIKRFMELMVIPGIENEQDREVAIDEMPQSANGKIVMTTEPKFIPKTGCNIRLNDQISVKVKLIDCVGYMVDGAAGNNEDGNERMVSTPWFDYDIPFSKAAEIGTNKVINNHSNIGIVVTTDGSFGEIGKEAYMPACDKTIKQLKDIGKPYVVIVNSATPSSQECIMLQRSIKEQYGCQVMAINCELLTRDDINRIFTNILYAFPVATYNFYIPKWLEISPDDNEIKKSVIENAVYIMKNSCSINDINNMSLPENNYVNKYIIDNIDLATGNCSIRVDVKSECYYQMLSALLGTEVGNEYDFLNEIKVLSENRALCKNILDALNAVKASGYGYVMPKKDEISLDPPEIIKTGNKYGIKIKATAPSIHMIKADITTEVAPIVGTKEQADDLIEYINNSKNDDGDIWNVNVFGKTIWNLVDDGISSKSEKINDASKQKLQDTMEKIVNDSNGGMVCIII